MIFFLSLSNAELQSNTQVSTPVVAAGDEAYAKRRKNSPSPPGANAHPDESHDGPGDDLFLPVPLLLCHRHRQDPIHDLARRARTLQIDLDEFCVPREAGRTERECRRRRVRASELTNSHDADICPAYDDAERREEALRQRRTAVEVGAGLKGL